MIASTKQVLRAAHILLFEKTGNPKKPVGLEIGELVRRVQPLHYGFPFFIFREKQQ